MDEILKKYEGTTLNERVKIGNDYIDAYITSPDIVDAVNLAIQLDRPLLIMGEPGCGKTRLAEAVAYELHGDKMNDYYFRWDIKSTTKAKDGIYQYDALKRLYHTNLTKKDAENMGNYITEGPLAKAFTKPQNPNGAPNVFLIDEIDKADIDFPNDLLLELEKKEYVITEWDNKKIQAESRTVIFVTSNQEKELPSAFLRRCLYHFIEFPDRKKLKDIIGNYANSMNDSQVEEALNLFKEIRETLDETDKKPSTSELIDWFRMLDFYTEKKNGTDTLTPTEKRLIAQLDQMNIEKVPFHQILLKTSEARQKILNG